MTDHFVNLYTVAECSVPVLLICCHFFVQVLWVTPLKKRSMFFTFCILKKNRKNLTAVQFVGIIRWFLLQNVKSV